MTSKALLNGNGNLPVQLGTKTVPNEVAFVSDPTTVRLKNELNQTMESGDFDVSHDIARCVLTLKIQSSQGLKLKLHNLWEELKDTLPVGSSNKLLYQEKEEYFYISVASVVNAYQLQKRQEQEQEQQKLDLSAEDAEKYAEEYGLEKTQVFIADLVKDQSNLNLIKKLMCQTIFGVLDTEVSNMLCQDFSQILGANDHIASEVTIENDCVSSARVSLKYDPNKNVCGLDSNGKRITKKYDDKIECAVTFDNMGVVTNISKTMPQAINENKENYCPISVTVSLIIASLKVLANNIKELFISFIDAILPATVDEKNSRASSSLGLAPLPIPPLFTHGI